MCFVDATVFRIQLLLLLLRLRVFNSSLDGNEGLKFHNPITDKIRETYDEMNKTDCGKEMMERMKIVGMAEEK